MAYEITFVLHIIGALATGMVGAYALVALWNHFAEKYRFVAVVLGGLAAFEVLSGTTLSVLSLQISAASLCSRIVLYLSLVFVIEGLLLYRMHRDSLVFPLVATFTPILASLTALFAAVVYGF